MRRFAQSRAFSEFASALYASSGRRPLTAIAARAAVMMMKNIAVATVLPYPMRNDENASLYMYVAISSVARDGPPSVMTQIRSKYFSEPISESVIAVMMMPRINGNSTRQKYWPPVAPSIAAASRSSLGMLLSREIG